VTTQAGCATFELTELRPDLENQSHDILRAILMLSICRKFFVSVRRVMACVVLFGVADTLAVAQDQRQLAEAERLNSQVVELYKAGKFAEAIPIAEQVLKIWETELGPIHPDIPLGLTNLGDLNSQMGNKTAARSLHQRALRIRERIHGQNHADTALSATYVAMVSESLGDYQTAEKHFRQALTIREKVFGTQHAEVASALNNIAHLLKTQDKYAEAEPLFLRGLEIRRKTQGSQHIDNAPSLDNLAAIYTNQSRFDEAEPLYKQALKIRQAHFGQEHPVTAITLNNLAVMYDGQRRFDEAEKLYRSVLRIRERVLGSDHPDTVATLGNLARQQQRLGDEESIDTFDLARRGIREHVAKELPALSESEQSLFLKANYEMELFSALSCGLLHSDRHDAVQKSASWLLNGKAVGNEALAQRTLAKRNNAGSTTPPAWVEVNELRKAIPANAVLIDIARFARFDFELHPGAATWSPAHYAAWITPAAGNGDIQLIDLGPADRIDALVKEIRGQLLKAHGDKGEIAVIGEQAAVQQVSKSLQAMADLVWKPLVPHLGDAKELLLSPDADLWLLPWAALPVVQESDDTDSQWLIENYSLRLLTSGRDLIRPQVVAHVKSPIILANPKFDERAAVKEQSILGIFKKLFPQDEDELRSFSALTDLPDVTPLPNTELEAIAIQPHLETYTGQSARVYKQRYALESVVKKLESPQVVVLATHGFFLPEQQVAEESSQERISTGLISAVMDQAGKVFENPLRRCGLLLTGCNQQGVTVGFDDGILTGAEVTSIDLRGTELVVLSACETGLGDINQGEGVAGLRQAFQLAGAESVVASLWQVSDRSTALLISDFFRNLAEGQSKVVALKNAQLSRISSRRQRYGAAHPFYWAAFTLTGR